MLLLQLKRLYSFVDKSSWPIMVASISTVYKNADKSFHDLKTNHYSRALMDLLEMSASQNSILVFTLE